MVTNKDLKRMYSIREILSRYSVKVNHKGFCNCMFHSEKTDSMKVYENSFYCFGCGASGDIFTLVSHFEECNFQEAFVKLGGNYADKDDFAAVQKQKSNKFEAEKQRQEELLKLRQKLQLSELIDYFYKLSKEFEPLSDGWCKCQNYMFNLLYAWEEKYINREDVNVRGIVARYKKSECIRDIIRSDFP